ncbi:MAG TPA: folate family ECF transporter S component [Erysipelotrichaceae bacterium]|nr:folate family ECF transporter S component [Erysipelotrichaceae bacterium]
MFTREYWKSSAQKLRQTEYLALIAMFIAVKCVAGAFYIPVGENLRILMTFVFVASEAAIIGPVAGAVSGMIADIVGFMIHPSGPFFFGYTITAMCGSVIYALFLYRQRITILRLALAKTVVNYGVNVLLGALWSQMLYGKGYIYYAGKSLVKNTMMLPAEIIILVLLFNVIVPILQKRRLIPNSTTVPLKLY